MSATNLLSIKDLAKLFGCSVPHVRRMYRRGETPPCVRFGRLVRFPRESVEAWLAAGGTPHKASGADE